MAATTIKAHKIRLHPTPEQEDYLRRAAGTRRFVYNWGLAEWNKQYAEYKDGTREKKPTANALKQQFQALRETAYPWTLEVTKCVVEGAFADLHDAWTRYFKGQNERPTFKKKHKCRDSFSLANDKFTVGDHWMVVPVLGRFLLHKQEANDTLPTKIRNVHQYKRSLGKVNLAESLRFVVPQPNQQAGKRRNEGKKVPCSSVKILGATIGRSGGYWYASIQVAVPAASVVNTGPLVGIEAGTTKCTDRYLRVQACIQIGAGGHVSGDYRRARTWRAYRASDGGEDLGSGAMCSWSSPDGPRGWRLYRHSGGSRN